jgi:putative colanic acid biosynthesis acetyltransferase WcaF
MNENRSREMLELSDAQIVAGGSRFSLRNRAARLAWQLTWLFLFRPSPRLLYFWRNALLRLFGAQIGRHVRIMPSARIWAPWNLRMGDYSAIGENVDCYSVAQIEIGRHALVSQYCFLCTASHDHRRAGLPGFDAPIRIGNLAWVCADVYLAPGVVVGDGTVVGARASVFTTLEPWVIAVGHPAKVIGKRHLTARDGTDVSVPPDVHCAE